MSNNVSTISNILENKYLRRSFWISTLGILFSLLMIRFFLIGDFAESDTSLSIKLLSRVIETLIAMIITTTGVGAFIFYLTPKSEKNDNVRFLTSNNFNQYFNKALINSKEWYFRGGLGRFISTEVLPKMNKVASETQSPVIIKAQILNPKNVELCDMHAQLRNSVVNGYNKNDWTCRDIRVNLYSTIVTCAIYESNNSYLDVSIFLINFFSTDRIDISTKSGIITKDDRNVPGLSFGRESILYNSYLGDLAVTQKQGDIVKPLSKPYKIGKLLGKHIKEILEELNLYDSSLDDSFLKEIAWKTNEQINPYA